MRSLLDTQRVLLSPHEYSDLDAWRSEASSLLKRLTNATKATFYLPIEGVQAFHSDDLPNGFADRWQRHVRHVSRTHGVLKKAEYQTVFTRQTIFAEDPEAYYRSDTFHEVLRPAGIYDSAGMHCKLLDGEKQALVFVHFDRKADRETARAAAVLRLLRDAAAAGVSRAETVRVAADELCTLIERLELGVRVQSLRGDTLFLNARFRDLIGRSATLACRVELECAAIVPPGASSSVVIDAEHASFRITRQQVRHWHPLMPDVVVTIIEPTERAVPSQERLRSMFGLTRREAEIARHLSKRLTNKEITTLTGVKECTVRRHTEAVLAKMGIHSRHDVMDRIARATSERH